MAVLGDNWKPGHILSDDEVALLESLTGLDEVLAVATHPTPGGYFSDPYEGAYLQSNGARQVFAREPDPEDEELPSQVTYLGDGPSDEALIRMVTEFIISNDHEIAAAIHFHFSKNSFGRDEWFWQTLPDFYWFRLGSNFAGLSASLDGAMQAMSPLYEYLSRFFENPSKSEFADFRATVARENGFSNAFERFKYTSWKG